MILLVTWCKTCGWGRSVCAVFLFEPPAQMGSMHLSPRDWTLFSPCVSSPVDILFCLILSTRSRTQTGFFASAQPTPLLTAELCLLSVGLEWRTGQREKAVSNCPASLPVLEVLHFVSAQSPEPRRLWVPPPVLILHLPNVRPEHRGMCCFLPFPAAANFFLVSV